MSRSKPAPTTAAQFITELNTIAYSAGLHVQRVFTDWLQMVVCALSMKTMEDEYLKTVKHYAEKNKDLPYRIAELFGSLVIVMHDKPGYDVMGDIFMEAVSRGNNGQFFTPTEVCRVMARMTGVPDKGTPSVLDPACGSGRCLLAVAEINPHCVFVGQDNDHTCTQMLAVNLCLNGLNGYAVHGNSLTNEIWRVYKIGSCGCPVIYRVGVDYYQRQFTRETHENDAERIARSHVPDGALALATAQNETKDKKGKRRQAGGVAPDAQAHPEKGSSAIQTPQQPVIYIQRNLFGD